jgi:hypothetical protein
MYYSMPRSVSLVAETERTPPFLTGRYDPRAWARGQSKAADVIFHNGEALTVADELRDTRGGGGQGNRDRLRIITTKYPARTPRPTFGKTANPERLLNNLLGR